MEQWVMTEEQIEKATVVIEGLPEGRGDRVVLQNLLDSYVELAEAFEVQRDLVEEAIETSVKSRKAMAITVQREWEGSKRYHNPSSIIVFSIDSDNEAGYEDVDLSAELVELIKNSTRMTDTIGVVDSGIFAVVVPTTNNVQAAWLSEKLRERIENYEFSNGIKITCSFGVADSEASMDSEDWMTIAVVAHDKAIAKGGNQVVDYEEDPE